MEWFILCIFGSVFLGGLMPNLGSVGGPLHPEKNVNIAVGFICFENGLKIDFKDLIKAGTNGKVCGFALFFSFIFMPVSTVISRPFLLLLGFNEWLLKGLVVASVMPPSITSAIIMTRAARGNIGAAIFISIVGSIIGIVFTPLNLYIFLGTTAMMPIEYQIITLMKHILLPLLLGQCMQSHKKLISSLRQLPLSILSQAALLFIIFTSFCESFSTHDSPMNAFDIICAFMLVVPLQITMFHISYYSACMFGCFSPEDMIALMFCSVHKSFSIGLSILKILYSGYAHFALISLPLLVYYPSQVLVTGYVIPMVRKWILSDVECNYGYLPHNRTHLDRSRESVKQIIYSYQEVMDQFQLSKHIDTENLV